MFFILQLSDDISEQCFQVTIYSNSYPKRNSEDVIFNLFHNIRL